MALSKAQERRLARLDAKERRARAAADAARQELHAAIRDVYADGSVREIATHVSLSPQRVWQILG